MLVGCWYVQGLIELTRDEGQALLDVSCVQSNVKSDELTHSPSLTAIVIDVCVVKSRGVV